MFTFKNKKVKERMQRLCISNTVFVQETALVLNGLTRRLEGEIYIYSGDKILNGIGFPGIEFFYFDNYDVNHFMESVEGLKNVKIPTRERALIDYYRLNEYDGETLLQAVRDYFNTVSDSGELKKVADFYHVSWKDILDLNKESIEVLSH